MSKHNKVNKSNYDQAGRLTPDDLAREHKKQDAARGRTDPERVTARERPPLASPVGTHRETESEGSE